jgi:hypothetical protein
MTCPLTPVPVVLPIIAILNVPDGVVVDALFVPPVIVKVRSALQGAGLQTPKLETVFLGRPKVDNPMGCTMFVGALSETVVVPDIEVTEIGLAMVTVIGFSEIPKFAALAPLLSK